MSTQEHDHVDRPWQEIAAALTQEKDPEKVVELSDELSQALNKSNAELPHPRSAPDDLSKAS